MNDSREILLELARAHWGARVLHAAEETGVFAAIGSEGSSAAAVAARAGLNPPATEILLDALAGLGVLAKEEGRYRPTEGMADALDPESPDCILPYVRHLGRGWDALGGLAEVVRRGPGALARTLHERDPEAAREFAGGMDVLARRLAPRVAAGLDLSGRRRLLDVGAGSGAYSVELLRRWPELEATLVDRAAVLEVARQRLDAAELGGRARFFPADYLEDDLPSGHDVALMSAVLHQHGDEACARLLAAGFRSLAPEGILVVRDWVMSPDGIRPGEGAVFSAAILASTGEGRCRTGPELAALLTAAGFRDVRLPAPGGKSSVATAVRSSEDGVQRQSS